MLLALCEYIIEVCASHLIISSLIVLVALVIGSYYAIRPRNLPPGPWGFPWIGSPHLISEYPHHDFDKLSKKYGDIFTLMMGLRPLIIINSNRLIKECFVKRGSEFSSRPAMYNLNYMDFKDEWFNVPYSKQWRDRKNLMGRILRNAGFGSGKVEETFLNHVETVLQHMDKGTPVSPKEHIQVILAMTLADVVYGAKQMYNDPDTHKLMKLALAWNDTVYKGGMALGYWTDNVHHLITQYLFPTLMKNMKVANYAFQDFLMEKIHQHRKTFVKGNVNDVIDGYLEERGDDPELTDTAFAGTILMLFPDGIDATGTLLQFILMYLAAHPEWQEKVQKQVDQVCGLGRASLRYRKALPLVEATIYEVTRLTSVVCLSIAHCPVSDTTFEGYNIPKYSYILANISAANNEKELFPQGESFAPATLIGKHGKFVRNVNNMAFSCGQRMCLCEQMVKNEAFLFVTTILQRFNIRFPQGEPPPVLTNTKGGLIQSPPDHCLCFHPRTSSN